MTETLRYLKSFDLRGGFCGKQRRIHRPLGEIRTGCANLVGDFWRFERGTLTGEIRETRTFREGGI